MLLTQEVIFTGTQINYYIVCSRKVWLYSNFISMEHTSQLVSLGKLIQDYFYKKSKKNLIIDDKISIDFIRKENFIILHEIKKSKSIEKAHVYQLLYYLYYLKKKGIFCKGIINYPLIRKVVEIELDEEKEEKLKKIFEEIKSIISLPIPPRQENKTYCKKCSYYEFCWC